MISCSRTVLELTSRWRELCQVKLGFQIVQWTDMPDQHVNWVTRNALFLEPLYRK